jgi:hypothetical protein
VAALSNIINIFFMISFYTRLKPVGKIPAKT